MPEKIKAVHDSDLLNLLKSLGIYSKFLAGKCKCKFCENQITFENLHSIFPEGGDIKFTCDRPECIRSLMEKIEKKNYG